MMDLEVFPFIEDIGNGDARSRLMLSAAQRIATYGISATKVRDICVDADVSRTSFYREFDNVDAIAAAVVATSWGRLLRKGLNDVAAIADGRERWSVFLLRQVEFATAIVTRAPASAAFIAMIGLMYRDGGSHHAQLVEAMRSAIETDRASGVLRTDVSTEEMADWIFRQIWALSSVPFVSDHADQPRKMIDSFVLLALLKEPDNITSTYALLTEIRDLARSTHDQLKAL